MQYIFNLELNFVYNQDILAGNYESALMGFENVIKIRPDHAIAYHYASVCYKALGDLDAYKKARKAFEKHAKEKIWADWIDYFKIPLDTDSLSPYIVDSKITDEERVSNF